MNTNILLIKNTPTYLLEEIIGLTNLNLKNTFNFDNFDNYIDLLEDNTSEFDAVILEMEFDHDFEEEIFKEISKLDKLALIIVTSAKNEENAKKLTENYIILELLTAPLLEKSILLTIEKKRNADLNEKLENYQQLMESKNIFGKDSLINENELFNQDNSTRSELKWLGILLNAVPCGIIILDSRDSYEFFVNRELLKMFGNENLDGFCREKNLIRIDDINNFNLYTPEGEKIADENFPSIKSIINGEDIENIELVIKYDDYNEKDVIINSSPVFDKSGNIIASITAISDVSKLKTAEKDLISTIKAKNIISEEFNDRVLNILQTMTNLLCVNEELERPEQYNEFYLNENKINKVIGLSFIQNVHEQLLNYDDIKQIDFNEYVHEICSKLFRIYNANRFVDLTIEGYAPMTLDMLLPCGLIINDIINYRLKSFSNKRKVELLIQLKAHDGRITMEIVDNGPKADNPIRMKSMSNLKLTHALLEQLSGIIRIETNNQQTSFFVEILYLDINDILGQQIVSLHD